MKARDLTNKKFGRLVAIKRIGTNKHRHAIWLCHCFCGKEATPIARDLINGDSQSCGCRNKEITSVRSKTHGKSRTRIYGIWKLMLRRCNNKSVKEYKYYGGRGIKVCKRWNDLDLFIKDMGSYPTDKHSIDRIDNDGNYEPKNCRWATMKEQAQNKRKKEFEEV